MTRSKPDQRRWSFCESVTAGVRESVCEGRKEREREGGGDAAERVRQLYSSLCVHNTSFLNQALLKLFFNTIF